MQKIVVVAILCLSAIFAAASSSNSSKKICAMISPSELHILAMNKDYAQISALIKDQRIKTTKHFDPKEKDSKAASNSKYQNDFLVESVTNTNPINLEVLDAVLSHMHQPENLRVHSTSLAATMEQLLRLAHKNVSKINTMLLRIANNKNFELSQVEGYLVLLMTAAFGATELLKTIMERFGKENSAELINSTSAAYGFLTPLMFSVLSKNEEMLRLILSYKPDLETIGSENETALMMAVKSNNVEFVQLLLEAGAKKSTKNSYLKTAIDFAHSEELKSLLLP